MRVEASSAPPGRKGTTIVMGLDGSACPCATDKRLAKTRPAAAKKDFSNIELLTV
jgi:hypothetical protein